MRFDVEGVRGGRNRRRKTMADVEKEASHAVDGCL